MSILGYFEPAYTKLSDARLSYCTVGLVSGNKINKASSELVLVGYVRAKLVHYRLISLLALDRNVLIKVN